VTTRVAATLALALVLVGCGSLLPDQVRLLTGSGPCFLLMQESLLVFDPTYGTAIDGGATPVAWPPGFTGRRVGSEVEVLDPHGNVYAVTGHNFTVSGGYASEGVMGVSLSFRAPRAFLECDARYR